MTQQVSPQAFALRGVSKAFRYFKLENLSLELPLGQILGLVGPNGAGKSTTIRLLMGLMTAETGSIEVLGHRVPEQVAAAKAGVAFVSDDMRLFSGATLAWHMRFVASIYPEWDEAYARTLLKHFNLRAEQGVKGLSRGEHIKSMLLLALARRPRLLILDEPTSGLDPVARHELLTELMQIVRDESRSILFSSHNTLDVERICDQIAFIDRGRLVDARDKESFLDRWRRISLDVPSGVTLPRLKDVVNLTLGEQLATLTTDRYEPALDAVLQASGARITDVQRMSLEEIFVASVMRSRAEVQS
ncbi:MAG TPA: ABC transporter ATP-binding protein [Steroidobacteraceae bacterium]|nr:ABC transporter ATP-binding protein [Steroidobacteraceae bacterium]